MANFKRRQSHHAVSGYGNAWQETFTLLSNPHMAQKLERKPQIERILFQNVFVELVAKDRITFEPLFNQPQRR